MRTVKSKRRSNVVRRSFALPRRVVEEAAALAPAEMRSNWNRLVRTALEQFIIQRKRERFAEEMVKMAQDPQTMADERRVVEDFAETESDGLA